MGKIVSTNRSYQNVVVLRLQKNLDGTRNVKMEVDALNDIYFSTILH